MATEKELKERFDRMLNTDRYYEYNNAIFKCEAGYPPGLVTHIWHDKQWVPYKGDSPAGMYGDPMSKEEAESY